MIQHFDEQTDAYNVTANVGHCVIFDWTSTQGATADADGIIDGGACSASESATIEADEGHDVLPACRNVTATPGGTAANIKAVQVKVIGTDINGDYQEEDLPAFTADATTKVTGTKCFSRVKKVTVPAMDGDGVTVDVGFGDVYGLPYKFTEKPLYSASVDGVVKTATLTVAQGAWTTVSFQTAPSNKAAKLALIF